MKKKPRPLEDTTVVENVDSSHGMTRTEVRCKRVGTIDSVANGRIRLARRDSGEGQHKGHAHFIDLGLVADVEGQRVRLSANAAVAVTLEEEQSETPV